MNWRELAGRLRFCCTLAVVVDGAVLQQARFDCVRYRALEIFESLQSLRLGAATVCFSAVGAIDCVSTLNTGGSLSNCNLS
jgi:hypothetical protein